MPTIRQTRETSLLTSTVRAVAIRHSHSRRLRRSIVTTTKKAGSTSSRNPTTGRSEMPTPIEELRSAVNSIAAEAEMEVDADKLRQIRRIQQALAPAVDALRSMP